MTYETRVIDLSNQYFDGHGKVLEQFEGYALVEYNTDRDGKNGQRAYIFDTDLREVEWKP